MKSFATCGLAASLFLAGCAAPPYVAQPIENDAELVSNVVVTDGELNDIIRVGNAGVERVSGSNQLKIVVPIRNIDDEMIQVLVQASFLNLQKAPIGDDTNRQVMMLPPGSTVNHTVISKTADAKDWTLRISWNR